MTQMLFKFMFFIGILFMPVTFSSNNLEKLSKSILHKILFEMYDLKFEEVLTLRQINTFFSIIIFVLDSEYYEECIHFGKPNTEIKKIYFWYNLEQNFIMSKMKLFYPRQPQWLPPDSVISVIKFVFENGKRNQRKVFIFGDWGIKIKNVPQHIDAFKSIDLTWGKDFDYLAVSEDGYAFETPGMNRLNINEFFKVKSFRTKTITK